MNNYQFCIQWILLRRASANNIHVLDYGCGAGEIVKELRNQEVNAFGCDIFYGGGDYSVSIDPIFWEQAIIRRMEGNTIPFDRDSFDFVINNQVMEHVKDLNRVLAEIHRVLKPGGMVLSLFPDKNIWREVHWGIPFLHWFSKGSRARIFYAALFRALGFGHHKTCKNIIHWSNDACDWLDQWTHYRTERTIKQSYCQFFNDIQHIEDYWLQQRLGTGGVVSRLPRSIQRFIARKLAGVIFIARKAF